ncbi:MAG: class I SAM-dependent methyltransferase family protein [Candidatus Bathyarchaeota archaeon]|uniref:class I SAM-dependent methyltransferase n=1 Tax=Candidatus Bathycorpusculum sp. TaxID=2994959 RepID=UPI002822610C|nr:class I SAM-dependent methyltransferase family protein [Candidatus Termiticorpusculum sp.]MCL2257800.1 class I SAM-dependent methyltransferase family protein [Candidatus Termiticorpusculum sp.]MCL2291473.1 class I SAM-dependent methyltransferase family protein [Candidatus Termiticorpusculum sp.]
MRRRLKAQVTTENSVNICNSYDIIGDIAVIKTLNGDVETAKKVADEIMKLYSKKIKAVFMQISAVQGDFRVRQLSFLAGENRTVTLYKEHGCLFRVDIERCYLSPRLLFEHKRIPALVMPDEVVVNMFSGVGCFSVLIAKTSGSKVYSIDVNPTAYEYMKENVRLNGVSNCVIPLLGDSKEIINSQLQGIADRVLMPLPELAFEYLPYALLALKSTGGWIHFFDFQHAAKGENPIEKTRQKVAEHLDALGICYSFGFSRVIRSVGPYWYQTVLDIYVSVRQASFYSNRL